MGLLEVVCGITFLLGACLSSDIRDFSPPRMITPPTIVENPSGRVPLSALITFTTDEPATASVEINNDGKFNVAEAGMSLNHSVPVLGLRAGRTNRVRILLIDGKGNFDSKAAILDITTSPLPQDFPIFTIRVADLAHVEPGMTLFNVSRSGGGPYGLLVAVDNHGEVVWYYRSQRPISDARRTRGGRILFLEATDAVEMDLLGYVKVRWRPQDALGTVTDEAIPVQTNTFHHEIAELPNGNLLTLSNEVRQFESYPTSEVDPGSSLSSANVVGDVIVEFNRDGAVVNEWPLFDFMDPYRIGYDSLSGFWDKQFRDRFSQTRDWMHANGVSYDSSDDSFIVSSRHQDAVFKIGRETRRLRWILGEHGGWNFPWNRFLLSPTTGVEWPFHQHAAVPTGRGSIMMFDNGNFRARPHQPKLPTSQSYSRAVEYRINEQDMSISQIWSYGGAADELFFSSILGYSELLPLTGNVLITDGARLTDASGKPSESASGTSRWARIMQVTHTMPATKTFELIVGDPNQRSIMGWMIYRARHLVSLY